MNYTLHQLQVFVKVVDCGGVTKAAEELFLTQPAVSIQLRNFQDQFDIPLTEVVGRRLYVTDFGMAVAESAREVLAHMQSIQSLTLAYKGKLVGRLKLSVVSTGKYVMPFFLTDFMRHHPGVELEMDVTNKQRVVEHLEQNAVDFALVSILPASLAVERLDLLPNRLFLVGNAPIQGGRALGLVEALAGRPLIYREPGSGTRQAMEEFMAKEGIGPPKTMTLTSNEAVKQAVLAGLGYSIMPLIGLRSELQAGLLHTLPVTGLPIETTWSLIWPKGKRHGPVAQAFLESMRQDRELIATRFFSWCMEGG